MLTPEREREHKSSSTSMSMSLSPSPSPSAKRRVTTVQSLSPLQKVQWKLPSNVPWQIKAMFDNPENGSIIRKELAKLVQPVPATPVAAPLSVVFSKRPRSVKPKEGSTVLGMDIVMKIAKEILRDHLQNRVVARLGKSQYGVGVFAFRDIPKGMYPFTTPYGKCVPYHTISFSKKEVSDLDPTGNLMSLMVDFFLDSDGNFPIPALGPNAMDISFYLNHSETPNLGIDNKSCDMTSYFATRDIKAGEELAINYCEFDIADEVLKGYMPFLTCNKTKTKPKTVKH